MLLTAFRNNCKTNDNEYTRSVYVERRENDRAGALSYEWTWWSDRVKMVGTNRPLTLTLSPDDRGEGTISNPLF